MKKLVKSLLVAVGLAGSGAAVAATPVQDVEWAVYEVCPLMFDGKLKLDDAKALDKLGFRRVPLDEEGEWAALSDRPYSLTIGKGGENPGCRIRYSGADSVALYEELLTRALKRGFEFPDGARKAKEDQFVMDTLATGDGPIMIISMFRIALPGADGFAMTVFPQSAH
jgi:hypothetical protein